jgi:RNA polymerase sigma-70 factor (ECF subfamily)
MTAGASDNQVLLERAFGGDCGALAELFHQYRDRLEQMVRLRLDRRLQGRLDPADVGETVGKPCRGKPSQFIFHPA